MDKAACAHVPEPAVAVERVDGLSPIVLICDHASNHLPACYGDLGLTANDLLQHFAWDPGALALSRQLSDALDAALVRGRISRLVFDVNLRPSDFDAIVETADGRIVPGNAKLSPEERERRVSEVYEPYHAAIEDLLARRAARGRPSALVAIHTFAPSLRGLDRPWHCGVIFASDCRLGEPLVRALKAEAGLVVGVNEPYAPSDGVYHTMARHGDDRGNPAVMIEVRNDLVASEAGKEAWAERLVALLRQAAQAILESEGPQRPRAAI